MFPINSFNFFMLSLKIKYNKNHYRTTIKPLKERTKQKALVLYIIGIIKFICLVEPHPYAMSEIKARNRNATVIQTCLSTETKPQVLMQWI